MLNQGVYLRVRKVFNRDYQLYLLCLPAIILVFIFSYMPMYGVQIAFKNFIAAKGIWGSPWVGLEHFIRYVNAPQFWDILKNTLILSIYGLIAGFPFPIILALLLNHCGSDRFKKSVQTISYAPHFISTVVMCGMILIFLSPGTGLVNNLLEAIGIERIFFMGRTELFSHIYVWSGVWQGAGWGTIIYTAALSAISQELYEAAKIDGASKFKTIFYIEIPSIVPTIVILLILNIGGLMNVGFQKTFLLQNPMNLANSEVISTYVYKAGLLSAQFEYATAIDLFNNIVNIILILFANFISKRISKTSLW